MLARFKKVIRFFTMGLIFAWVLISIGVLARVIYDLIIFGWRLF